MIAAMLLAQAVVAPAGPVEAAVPATEWSCRLVDAAGAAAEWSGTVPALPRGRDPNRSIFADVLVDGVKDRAAITGDGGEWIREYQLARYDGDDTLVLNLKLRKGSTGAAYLTRFGSAERNAHEPYRYVSAGLCTAEFGGAR